VSFAIRVTVPSGSVIEARPLPSVLIVSPGSMTVPVIALLKAPLPWETDAVGW